MIKLTGFLAWLAEQGHETAALKLFAAWAGQDRYIPSDPKVGNEIVDIIGLTAAKVLAEKYGDTHQYVPRDAGLGKKKAAIGRLADSGLDQRAIAAEAGCSTRWVRKVINGDEDESQPFLPFR